jgi:excinuclease UvrABC nuclease subunit
MPEIATLLEGHAQFDPMADFEPFLLSVPARWVVYLLSDADDRPLQLLCVKNLRASLKRRLGSDEQIGPTKAVNYRDVVRHIRWRRVDSAFEADWLYYETARILFPRTYQGMVGFRPAWFVHVNPETAFPRYIKTIDLTRPGIYLGPLEDKHAAARFIEMGEDLFDLCRYYNILVEAPHGKPCAYKEMGKCPAPCNGSISMEQYRWLIDWSAHTLISPADAIREHKKRMEKAAAELRFETAAKIKSHVDQLSQLGKGQFRHARRLEDFRYLTLQRGPRQSDAKAFLITPGAIDPVACLIDEPDKPADLLRNVLAIASERLDAELDPSGIERIGIVAHHLFTAKQLHGVFLRLEDISEQSILKAYRELRKRPIEVESEAEGVLKELQSL